jgi:hypothetical protein
MPEVQRNIFFYRVEPGEGQAWRRAEVLRQLEALRGDDRLLDLRNGNYAWVKVDRIPQGGETGRARFFRIRRQNLPGVENEGDVRDLDIPETAGLAEPSHVVFGSNGLIAAEFNSQAPRMSALQRLLDRNLGMDIRIGTYLQGDIVEQLDRLEWIQLCELSIVPTPALEEELRNAGRYGDAVANLSDPDDARRVYLRLSAERRSGSWTGEIRDFAKRLLGMGADEEMAKVLRLTGYDPVTDEVEPVDLLQQKLLRRTEIERSSERSRALNTSSAYHTVEAALAQVRDTDLPRAALV